MPTEFDEQRHHRGRLLLESSPGLAWTTVALLLLCLLLLQSPLPTSASSDAASSAATAMLERMRAAAKAGSAASSTTAAGAGAGAAAAASTPESVQSVGSSYVIQALQRHNSSGTLPSVTALNEMLRTVNGEGALQLNESFTTAAASPTSTANNVFTNSVLGLNGNSAASYGVTSMPAGVASPFPSLSAVGSPGPLPGLSTTPAQLFALMDDVGGGFGLGGDGGGSYGAPRPEVEAGLRAIRFGIYDSLFGYLPYAGFQLLAIGNFILIKDEKAAFILFAVGNELIGLGFLFIGIKGTEATDVAVRALAVIIEEEATGKPAAAATGAAAPAASATALAAPQGAGFTPQPPAPVPGPISSAPISSVPPPVGTGRSSTDPILGGLSAGLPFTSAAANAQTATATAPAASASAGSTAPYTFLPPTTSASVTAAAASNSGSRSAKADASPLSCSSLLYGSWLRIETDAMGSGASPPKKAAAASASAAQQDESVLLRFSATSFERLERVRVGDKRRTRQQHWTGSLHVECEGESEGDDADWASLGVPISASGSTLVTVSMTGTGAGALLSDDSTALFFTYLPVQLSGNTNGVLVERSEFDESPTAAAHRRAYIRI